MEILPFFIKNIGPYAYKKLANVQSKTTFGGMENAGAIFYSENSITGKRSAEVLIAHEIAHQWFGNMATEADWSHVWLSEGFATYMAILYMESKYGQDTAQKMRIEDRMQVIAFSKQKAGPVVDSSTTNYTDLLNAYSYQKGGWVLHMLRRRLGDPTFWDGIRSYYATYAGKNATTDDLRKIMENVSGKDLKQFFQQWLHTPGHPVLDIHWKYNAGLKSFMVNITQQQNQPFEFPLTIHISVPGEKTLIKSAVIKDKLTAISFFLSRKPSNVSIDPEVNLLYEGSVRESR
jgi:aminopeptidase N